MKPYYSVAIHVANWKMWEVPPMAGPIIVQILMVRGCGVQVILYGRINYHSLRLSVAAALPNFVSVTNVCMQISDSLSYSGYNY